jgi:hypothetical protein
MALARHRPTVGSQGVAVSYERGTHLEREAAMEGRVWSRVWNDALDTSTSAVSWVWENSVLSSDSLRARDGRMYRGTSPIRNTHPPRTSLGP